MQILVAYCPDCDLVFDYKNNDTCPECGATPVEMTATENVKGDVSSKYYSDKVPKFMKVLFGEPE